MCTVILYRGYGSDAGLGIRVTARSVAPSSQRYVHQGYDVFSYPYPYPTPTPTLPLPLPYPYPYP